LTHQNCRSCGAKELIEILDLGFAPPSNALLSKEDLSKGEIHYPLVLLFCQECKLVQTRDFHSGEALFTPDYPYLSSTSTAWIKHSHDLVDSVIKEFNLDSNSLVAEIASNDGYLLERLAQRGIAAYGIEPTKLAADISIGKGHHVYNCFLNLNTASQIKSEKGAADVVIANNVFAHVPDLLEFTEAARDLLAPTGTLVAEIQYFPKLISDLAFDTIYHEHFSYFSLTSIYNLFTKCGLNIFHAEEIPTHGGSLRVFARKSKKVEPVSATVNSMLEAESLIETSGELLGFQNRVSSKRNEIRDFILQLKKSKESIIGVGAAAKGNTLLNYCGITAEDISMILDSATSKQGKFTPGSHIPIQPLERQSFNKQAEFLVLAWNLFDEFSRVLTSYSLTKPITLSALIPDIKTRRIPS